jgi:hypothetical protein
MSFCFAYFLLLSFFGWLLLVTSKQLFLGISISVHSPYNHIKNTTSNSISCYIASGVYGLLLASLIFSYYKSYRRDNKSDYIPIPTSMQEIELYDFIKN